MESVPPPKKTGISLIGAFFAMIITFLVGIYVGAHPGWFPSRWLNGGDSLGPTKMLPSATNTADPSAKDTTRPSMLPSTMP